MNERENFNNIIEFPKPKERLSNELHNFVEENYKNKIMHIPEEIDGMIQSYRKALRIPIGLDMPPAKEYMNKTDYRKYKDLLDKQDEYSKKQTRITLEALRLSDEDPGLAWSKESLTEEEKKRFGSPPDVYYFLRINDEFTLNLRRFPDIKSYVLFLEYTPINKQREKEAVALFRVIEFSLDANNHVERCYGLELFTKKEQKKIQSDIMSKVNQLKERME